MAACRRAATAHRLVVLLLLALVPRLAAASGEAGSAPAPPLAARAAAAQQAATTRFPFPNDFRDPNDVWGAGSKASFLCTYVACWACVVAAVHWWEDLASALGRFRSEGSRGATEQEEVAFLDADENSNVRDLSIGPTPPFPVGQCVHELFLEQAADCPHAVALVVPAGEDAPGGERHEVKYSELRHSVETLAAALLRVGVARGSVAALSLDRSCAQVIAVLGVLATGGGYLPIDHAAPPNRKKVVIGDSEAVVLMAEDGDGACVELAAQMRIHLVTLGPHGSPNDFNISVAGGRQPIAGQPIRPRSTDLAMLIYTSGTTGTPKGIIYDQAHLLHGAYFWAQEHDVDKSSVLLLKSPYFWAVIEWEMFPALVRGGVLVVASREGHKKPEYLARTVAEERVTVLMITPSVLDLLLDAHEVQSRPLQSLRAITCVGEPLPSALANRAVRMPYLTATLRNFYGASESSCSIYRVPTSGVDLRLFPNKAPAGLPQPHATVYLMLPEEEQLRLAPPGEAGEICFGGVLAAGYFKLDELTAQKFVQTEEYGRLYRTGDLGRWRGGVLEVIGRTDRQVKVHGVRIEPEEIEAVLKKMSQGDCGFLRENSHGETTIGRSTKGSLSASAQMAVRQAAVVTTPEPAELVAFVSLRDGVNGVGPEELQAHCKANLIAAYVPKHFVVLDGLPTLPNGKNDLAALKQQAAEHAQKIADAGEVVMDSLGRMRKMSQWALTENAVIHRCYAFWMFGVLLDHWARCAMDSDPADTSPEAALLPYCTAMASSRVKPWSELLIRHFGNDQDLFGFILLGAYQDARPETQGAQARVNLGAKDLYVFIIYLCMALPFPQLCFLLTGGLAWPDKTYVSYAWASDGGGPTGLWNWSYMERMSSTSGHRWYLSMVLQARLYMGICEAMRVPAWCQLVLVALPSLFGVGTVDFLWDVCESESNPMVLRYLGMWVFGPNGYGCPAWVRWVHWYTVFYVACFHYLRPAVARLTRVAPKGPAWATAATGASMTLGMVMALYHYPNTVLELGTSSPLALVELAVAVVQPVLFAAGTAYWTVNAAWWGNTTLGCYLVHFYFRDRFTDLFIWLGAALSWEPSGLLLPVVILFVCFGFTSTFGPLGHGVLIAPQLLSARAERLKKQRFATSSKLSKV